jgi:DNA polymerase V
LIAVSSNFELFADISDRMMSVIAQFGETITYSIDEAFLFIPERGGAGGTPTEFCQEIRKRVYQNVGIPIGVGIGETATLAKAAQQFAKKRSEWNRVCDLSVAALGSRAAVEALMETIEVGDTWGVGRQHSVRLNQYGIHSMLDLRRASPSWVRKQFSVVLEKTVLELNGISCINPGEVPDHPQQVICSRAFGMPILTEQELGEALSEYVSLAAVRLRAKRVKTNMLHIFITTSRFRTDEKQYSPGLSIPMTPATSDTMALIGAALAGLRKIYKPGYRYSKAGAMLLDLQDEGQLQHSLFSPALDSELMPTIDAINDRWGKGALRVASCGNAGEQRWRMKQNRMSPNFTTDFRELPVAWAR